MENEVVIGLLGFMAISAAWDAARRYFDVRRFNQRVLDDQQRIERDHAELSKKVQAISEKLSFNIGSQANRSPSRIGGMR